MSKELWIIGAIGIYLFYKPNARAMTISDQPNPGKYPGHIDELFKRGIQWFEDPLFFSRKE